MRPLTFSDDQEHEEKWLPGGPLSAVEAFGDFVARHAAEDNMSFRIEDEEAEEALWVFYGAQAVCRIKGAVTPRAEYRLVTKDADYLKLVDVFVHDGFDALDLRGPWWADAEALERARLRSEFEGSVLRRTHPRELRRRLEVLTRIDGHEPTTTDGVTRLGYGSGTDGTVNAWFGAGGRGLVVVLDRTSPLGSSEDGRAQAALYEGVPQDLLELVRVAPGSSGSTVASPDGGVLAAATGVFTLAGPCAMADGLVSRLQEARLGLQDTGVGRLLEVFLAVEDFTPAAVSAAAPWWSAQDVERGFAASTAPGPGDVGTGPLDQAALDGFCRIWADSGYNDRWDVHYVLFDGDSVEGAGDARDELLRLVQVLGLERVDSPPGATTGEVWVRTDPRVDAELGRWS